MEATAVKIEESDMPMLLTRITNNQSEYRSTATNTALLTRTHNLQVSVKNGADKIIQLKILST